jgi:hypothetical protein
VTGAQVWGWLRVQGFRASVRVRRSLCRYLKKRRVARVRRLVLVLSLVTLLGILAAQPGAGVTATAATGLAGILAARLAPGKVFPPRRR